MTDPTPWPTVVALSGDPQIGSRTAHVARRAAAALARTLEQQPTVVEIDLANVSARDEDLRRAILRARAVIVATPERDGWAATGLLEFLGGFRLGSLGGTPTAIVVHAADRDRGWTAERRLARYLAELGPDPTLPALVVDAVADDVPEAIAAWVAEAARPPARATAA